MRAPASSTGRDDIRDDISAARKDLVSSSPLGRTPRRVRQFHRGGARGRGLSACEGLVKDLVSLACSSPLLASQAARSAHDDSTPQHTTTRPRGATHPTTTPHHTPPRIAPAAQLRALPPLLAHGRVPLGRGLQLRARRARAQRVERRDGPASRVRRRRRVPGSRVARRGSFFVLRLLSSAVGDGRRDRNGGGPHPHP